MGGTERILPYPSKNAQMTFNHSPFPTKFLFSPHGPLESKKMVIKLYQNEKKKFCLQCEFLQGLKIHHDESQSEAENI